MAKIMEFKTLETNYGVVTNKKMPCKHTLNMAQDCENFWKLKQKYFSLNLVGNVIVYVANFFKLYIEFFKWLIFYDMYFICKMD